jgi:hypothetical protein
MERSDVEERAAKCNICSGELSVVENMIYGNRCLFCSPARFEISLAEYLARCYWDWRLYNLTLKLIERQGPDARLLYLGCISEIGQIDIAGVISIKQKRQLCKVLRRVGR